MTGDQANAAYHRAAELVKQGKYEEALKEELLPSDATVIVKKIEDAKAARLRS